MWDALYICSFRFHWACKPYSRPFFRHALPTDLPRITKAQASERARPYSGQDPVLPNNIEGSARSLGSVPCPVPKAPMVPPLLNSPGDNVVQSPGASIRDRLGLQNNYDKCFFKETANIKGVPYFPQGFPLGFLKKPNILPFHSKNHYRLSFILSSFPFFGLSLHHWVSIYPEERECKLFVCTSSKEFW